MPCSIEKVEEMLQDCLLAFQDQEAWHGRQHLLAELSQARTAASKMRVMLGELAEFTSKIVEGVKLEDDVECLHSKVDQAKGTTMQAEQQGPFKKHVGMIIEHLEPMIEKDLSQATAITGALASLKGWLDSKQQHMVKVEAVVALKKAYDIYATEGTVEARISGDVGGAKLMTMMRARLKLQGLAQEKDGSVWGQAMTCRMLDKALEAAKEAETVILASAKQTLEASCDGLKDIAGGMENGELWSASILAEQLWPTVLARAEETFMKIDVEVMGSKMKSLE